MEKKLISVEKKRASVKKFKVAVKTCLNNFLALKAGEALALEGPGQRMDMN